jgi:hypothetical protein
MEVSGQVHIQLLLLAGKGFMVLISWVGLRASLNAVKNRKAFYFWLIDNSVISYVEENVSYERIYGAYLFIYSLIH